MQKYKTLRAMCHKLRLRYQYYYGWKNMTRRYTGRYYYQFEKEQCKDLGRTCQSAFFTYNCPEPIWMRGLTYYEVDFGKQANDRYYVSTASHQARELASQSSSCYASEPRAKNMLHSRRIGGVHKPGEASQVMLDVLALSNSSMVERR